MDRLSDILAHKTTPSASLESTPETLVPHISQNDLRTLIINMKKDLDQMVRILDGGLIITEPEKHTEENITENVIEGVFNGQKMIDDEGNTYDVTPNYASKSKLVEGDMMKLTINKQGKFLYKQIGPIERQRIRGVLYYSETDSQWNIVTALGKSYKILTASVTFYKGKSKDEVVAFIPQNGQSEWAAVEHIISNT